MNYTLISVLVNAMSDQLLPSRKDLALLIVCQEGYHADDPEFSHEYDDYLRKECIPTSLEELELTSSFVSQPPVSTNYWERLTHED